MQNTVSADFEQITVYYFHDYKITAAEVKITDKGKGPKRRPKGAVKAVLVKSHRTKQLSQVQVSIFFGWGLALAEKDLEDKKTVGFREQGSFNTYWHKWSKCINIIPCFATDETGVLISFFCMFLILTDTTATGEEGGKSSHQTVTGNKFFGWGLALAEAARENIL